MQALAADLKTFSSDRLGDRLRSIFQYFSTGGDYVYLRADIEEQYTQETLAEIAGISYGVHQALTPLRIDPPNSSLGVYETTVHKFEGAYAVQAAVDEGRGFVVTYDESADVDPFVFSEEAQNLIDESKQSR
jgi:hypothetical protein